MCPSRLLVGLTLALTVGLPARPAWAAGPAVTAPPAPAPAYPIAPVPLRELVEESGLIVTLIGGEGGVTEVPMPAGSPSWAGARLRLAVADVLHGELPGASVDVQVAALICPAPAHYDSETRLAFLFTAGDKAPGLWWTVGMSYGAKNLDAAELAAYVTRIRELLVLLERPSSPERRRDVADWQLRCLADPATRGEALLDLGAQLAERRRAHPNSPARLSGFDVRRRDRLLSLYVSLARQGPLEDGFHTLVDALAGDDPRLVPALVDQVARCLERLDHPSSNWALPVLRECLVRRSGDAELGRLAATVVRERRGAALGDGHRAALERFLARARALVAEAR